ncbi:gamma-mobile-trio protein GmtX [Acinetobacter sp. ANC 5378]|uniref:gamma-mobile-trio protein GmtX n=1 Tax=Acinetobacter sp. ANC 5378 TaxID=2731249 RepID=UPI00148F4B08|nr:gamma-mobile-trio protein GmtX [Acinetobacter sp. ANC 5378]NNG81334.1 hypothetical protein [Acinetobacter sp. ANC 5378]
MQLEDLLNQLKKDSSSKVQQSLDAIFEVCKEQQERGINDFSISTIAHLGYKRGVPKAQSIRNNTGKKYKTLIQAFANTAQQSKTKYDINKSDEDWISEIQNPKHLLLVRILASELKEARQMLQEIIPPKQRIDIYDHKSSLVMGDMKFTEQEERALKYLLSGEFQKKWNLKPTTYGELIDEDQKPVFKMATLDAIRKALEYLT